MNMPRSDQALAGPVTAPDPSARASSALWSWTAEAGPIAGRFLADATARVPLAALADGTTIDASPDALRDKVVVIRTRTQLATALALLELDGLARRIVLCTPDLSDAHLGHALAASGAEVIVREDGTSVPESCRRHRRDLPRDTRGHAA